VNPKTAPRRRHKATLISRLCCSGLEPSPRRLGSHQQGRGNVTLAGSGPANTGVFSTLARSDRRSHKGAPALTSSRARSAARRHADQLQGPLSLCSDRLFGRWTASISSPTCTLHAHHLSYLPISMRNWHMSLNQLPCQTGHIGGLDRAAQWQALDFRSDQHMKSDR
jgi:hypothetical protein